jgi:methylenetetrahydrofolate dehydrogenase (NADP+)/methenyltetrahydrofolate cyclohydrolase
MGFLGRIYEKIKLDEEKKMAATTISGKELSQKLTEQLKEDVAAFESVHGYVPGLAVILVGNDPASEVYVNNKERACKRAGMYSEVLRLPADTTEETLFSYIDDYNKNEKIHGLLVQFPVPAPLTEERIMARISPLKDVDGLTIQNAGALMTGGKGLVSCTPRGIIELIKSTEEEINGKHAVVIGRSNLVGKPVAMLLLQENATVTICHSRTKDLAKTASEADILVAAIGSPEFVTGDFIKEGAIVIDVGTSRVDGKLKGDVLFAEAAEKAGYITPVPGGVGPMTITMLLSNTLEAAKLQAGVQ